MSFACWGLFGPTLVSHGSRRELHSYAAWRLLECFRQVAARLKRLWKKSSRSKKLASGAEAPTYFQRLSGPTEVGPFPKPACIIVFPQLLKSYPPEFGGSGRVFPQPLRLRPFKGVEFENELLIIPLAGCGKTRRGREKLTSGAEAPTPFQRLSGPTEVGPSPKPA